MIELDLQSLQSTVIYINSEYIYKLNLHRIERGVNKIK